MLETELISFRKFLILLTATQTSSYVHGIYLINNTGILRLSMHQEMDGTLWPMHWQKSKLSSE